nr:ComEC/Rec2 family competence protein [Eubacterium sp.]
MKNRPLLAAALAFILGIYAGTAGPLAKTAIYISVIVACTGWVFFPYPTPRRIILSVIVAAMPLLGMARYAVVSSNTLWYEGVIEDGDYVEIMGRVADKTITEDGITVKLDASVLTHEDKCYRTNCLIFDSASASATDDSGKAASISDTAEEPGAICIGDTVRLTGSVSMFEAARNPGNFDMKEYYTQKLTDFRIEPSSVETVNSSPDFYREALFNLKLRIRSVYTALLSEEDYGLLSTMVLGDRSLLSEDVKELYRTGGISHILAISGLHISIVGMLLYSFMRRRGFSFIACGVVSGTLVVSFAVMAQMGTATTRALIMFLLMIAANGTGDAYDALSAAGAAALVLLGTNPLLLFSASFALSFAAVTGAVVINPLLSRLIEPDTPALSSFVLCFSIQASTIPLSLYYYYKMPVWGVLVNIIILPFVSVVLLCGIAGGLIGTVFLYGASPFMAVIHRVFSFYEMVLTASSRLPFSDWVTGCPSVWGIVGYYVLLAVILRLLSGVTDRRKGRGKLRIRGGGGPAAAGIPCTGEDLLPARRKIPRRVARSVLSAGAMWGGLCLCVALCTFRPSPDVLVSMIDVGQGDGILVENPEGSACFFDGGSTDISKATQYRVRPFLEYKGISAIDCWFVSHTDEDHISCLRELMEDGYRIKTLCLAAGMVTDSAGDDLISLANANGTDVVYLSPGDTVTYGNEDKRSVYTCIFPDVSNSYTDKNDACLVMTMDYMCDGEKAF